MSGLSVLHVISQGVQAVAYVNVFAYHVLRQVKVYCSEVPDALDARIADSVRNYLGFFGRNGDYRYIYVLALDETRKIAAGHNLRILEFHILNNLSHIEDACDVEIALVVGDVAGHSLAKSAVSDDNNLILLIQSQNGSDLIIEQVDTVAVALLAETAEVVQVLTDLGGGVAYELAQVL